MLSRRLAQWSAAFCILAVLAPVAARGQDPSSYDLVSQQPGLLELHFHNMKLKAVHADDAQNALALDFDGAVDGAAFDRLAKDFPDWIALAFASFDTGVIRATRPVTFLTRPESDGFSLRVVPRAAPQVPASMPPAPPPPPPQPLVGDNESPVPLRNYALGELSLRGSDDVWNQVYRGSSRPSGGDVEIDGAYHGYHTGDRIIATAVAGRIPLGGGLSLIGSVYDTDAHGKNVRAPGGAILAGTQTNMVTGAGGLAFDTDDNTELALEALEGNNITGARLTAFNGGPAAYQLLRLSWHDSDRDTPEAIANRGLKDQAVLAAGYELGYGVWMGLDGRFTNYGIHGNASVAKTAGWDGNVHWNIDLGLLTAGLGYDGHGEYLLDHVDFTGAAPSPYIPLGIRDIETHAFTASLSGPLGSDAVWLQLYGGYIRDRYASDGAIFGGALRFVPAPGLDLALYARHSTVSTMQGEIGAETTAGLRLTLGYTATPVSAYF